MGNGIFPVGYMHEMHKSKQHYLKTPLVRVAEGLSVIEISPCLYNCT